jgi:hypothetical protein
MNHRTIRVLAGMLLLFVLLMGAPADGQNKKKKASPAPVPVAPSAPGAETDPQKLLAEKDRQRGPVFPGIDPAFLVLPRSPERNTTAASLLTDDVRNRTRQALEYLARTQDPDGGWSDTQFASNTGVTGLCCLALMAEGSRPRVGKYGRQLDRGLEFLLKNAQSGGVIAGKGSNPQGPGYEHALATLALLLAYGEMPWRPETRDVVARALQLLVRTQKLDGGWRYQMSREGLSDMSVTANVLWVLRSAKKAGFTIPPGTIEKGVAFVEKCALPDGHFRYRSFGLEAAPSLGGTGIIALAGHGKLNHPLIAPARDKIAYDYQRHTLEDLQERRYVVFGCFYASLAMYSCGDAYWVPWFHKAAPLLASLQRPDGEFPDQAGNLVYPTAMAAMVLQAPLGYLPIYER